MMNRKYSNMKTRKTQAATPEILMALDSYRIPSLEPSIVPLRRLSPDFSIRMPNQIGTHPTMAPTIVMQ